MSMTERYFTAEDGRRIFYQDFDGPADKPPLLCLPGLSRNHRDFAPVTERLAGTRRILCPDMRGRGRSDYARNPDAEYLPHVELADVMQLCDSLKLDRIAVIGTSRGGIQAMIWASLEPARLAAVALNDIGPKIETDGLAAIMRALGSRRQSFASFADAGAVLKAAYGDQFTGLSDAAWIGFARRIFRADEQGRPVPDYDPELVRVTRAAFDSEMAAFWPLFHALAPAPTLVLRGANSDLLSAQTLAQMAGEHPDCVAVTVPGRGHAPFLDEPEAETAIDALLARADG